MRCFIITHRGVIGRNGMHTHKAFSLIELLIVVAIIGSLAAVAVPSYKAYSAKAQIAKAIKASEAIANMQVVYLNANGSFNSRDGIGLPPQSPFNGCSNCVNLEYFGNITGVGTIMVAPLSCGRVLQIDVFFDNSFNGEGFWLRQRVSEVNGVMLYDCMIEGEGPITNYKVGLCLNNNWGVINSHATQACS